MVNTNVRKNENLKEIIINLSTDSLDKVQDYLTNGKWQSLCTKNNITTGNWESNLITIDVNELHEDGYSIPFIYFHLESDESQVYLQAEWYPDSSGHEFFRSSNVRDILDLKINDLWDGYSHIIFKESKDGVDIAEYLGEEIHPMD